MMHNIDSITIMTTLQWFENKVGEIEQSEEIFRIKGGEQKGTAQQLLSQKTSKEYLVALVYLKDAVILELVPYILV